jgi:hypothetical protein
MMGRRLVDLQRSDVMNNPTHQSFSDSDGVPTLMPDAQAPGTAGPGVRIGNFELPTKRWLGWR